MDGLWPVRRVPSDCGYDPLGRMWEPCENLPVAVLGFDGENIVRTGYDGQDYTWTFVHGPGLDDPLMGYKDLGPSDPLYLYWVTDGQGRQYAVGNADGYDYSQDNHYTMGGKFAGGTTSANSFDAERYPNPDQAKLSFFRHRFYDQETGRWTQEDPIGVAGGINLYAYTDNNPVNYTDPFGLCPPGSQLWWCPGAITEGLETAVVEGFNRAASWIGGLVPGAAPIAEAVAGRSFSGEALAGGQRGLKVAQAAGEIALAAAPIFATQGQMRAVRAQLATSGRRSVDKSVRSWNRNLEEHLRKLAEIQARGGNPRSVEVEIRNFRGLIEAAEIVLKQ